MKRAISLPDEFFARAAKFAQQKGLTRNEFFQRAVDAYLESQKADFVYDELNRVYASNDSKLDRSAIHAQVETLAPENW